MSTQLLGRKGEAMAAQYLIKKGYKLLESGYRSRYGEIDLIVQKEDIVVFVEVKLRKNDRFAPAYEAVTGLKQDRIRTTALQWLSQQEKEVQSRFDIIEVYTDMNKINHFENAFV